jgi:hypothetical protein
VKKRKIQLYQTGNLNIGTRIQNPAFGISRGIGVYGLETGLLHRNGGNNPKQWDKEIYPGPSFTWKPDRHRLEWLERRDPTAFGVKGGKTFNPVMIDPQTCNVIPCATVIEEMLPLMPPQLTWLNLTQD